MAELQGSEYQLFKSAHHSVVDTCSAVGEELQNNKQAA